MLTFYNFTLVLDMKPGKVRMVFKNFSNASKNANIDYSWKKVKKNVESMRSSLIGYLRNKKEDNNW